MILIDFQQQNFRIRPLPKDALIHAALTGILLLKLYWMMNDILMKPIKIGTEKFSNIYKSIDNQVDLMVQVNKGTHDGKEDIELNATEQLSKVFDLLIDI